MATNSQQPIEIDARDGRGYVERVDERDELATSRRRRHRAQRDAGPSRRSRTDQLQQLARGKTAPKRSVQRDETGRTNRIFIVRIDRRKRRRERAVETPGREGGDERSAIGTGKRHSFVLYSPFKVN